MKKMWAVWAVGLAFAALPSAVWAIPDSTLDDCAELVAGAAVGLAETYVEGLIRAMVVLAATDLVQTGDWDGMHDLLEVFEEASLPMATWFARPDGSYFTVDAGRASANLLDRDYFPVVMSGRIATGYVLVSRSTGRVSAVTAVPVTADGTIVGALGVSLFLDAFSLAIAEDLALPDGVAFYAATEDGRIALHSDPNRLLADVSEAGVLVEDTATAESPLLGWMFGVGPTE